MSKCPRLLLSDIISINFRSCLLRWHQVDTRRTKKVISSRTPSPTSGRTMRRVGTQTGRNPWKDGWTDENSGLLFLHSSVVLNKDVMFVYKYGHCLYTSVLGIGHLVFLITLSQVLLKDQNSGKLPYIYNIWSYK